MDLKQSGSAPSTFLLLDADSLFHASVNQSIPYWKEVIMQVGLKGKEIPFNNVCFDVQHFVETDKSDK